MLRLLMMVALGLLAAAGPAEAHKLNVFATAEGATVTGTVYLSDGSRPAGVAIAVEAAGTTVAETETDADGAFRFIAERRVDHLIIATIDGHRGTWTLRAGELPPTLPAAASQAEQAPASVSGAAPTPSAPSAPAVAAAQLDAVVAQAVARQVAPLRAEMQEWRQESRWRDIAGGLGWLIGLAGLAAWVGARRKG